MMYFSRIVEYLIIGFVIIAGVLAYAIYQADALPENLDWRAPVNLQAQENWMTDWKLEKAARDPAACLAALKTANAKFDAQSDLISDNPKCGIENRVLVREIAGVKMAPLETSCQTALKLATWLVYDAKPEILANRGAELRAISHFGSYSCRPVRTSKGNGSRMSRHATAQAVDISGFELSNGERLTLRKDWNGGAHELLDGLQRKACGRFRTVLGPNYNSLHADHFHMELGGWRACR